MVVALLATQLASRSRAVVAVAGAAIAALPIPLAPPGIPIIAATGAVVLGWKRG